MKPVAFEGQNIVLGKGQPQYMELPALRCDDPSGTVWACWELDEADIADLIKSKKLWVGQLTFRQSFSPQIVSSVMPGEVSIAAYKARQSVATETDTQGVAISSPTLMFYCPTDCTGYGYGKDGLEYYGVLRYAEGQWIPNDGEPDLAFIGYTPGGTAGGAPIFYGVETPHNISHHPNVIAYNAACHKCADINGCASGRTVNPEQCVAAAP